MSIKNWIKRFWFPMKKASWPVEMIEYPTDVHFAADGKMESVTLKGNLFWCAWGMKGIRQANPDFVEQWVNVDNVNESVVILRRASTRIADVFVPRGTIAPAQMIPDADLLPSPGHMDVIS